MSRGGLLLWALVVGSVAGCRSPQPATPALPPGPALPQVGRAVQKPDVTQLAAMSTTAASPAHPGPYYRLTAEECRTLACTHSAMGNLIDAAATDPPRNRIEAYFSEHNDVIQFRRRAAYQLSREARLRTSAGALELYYRLLEAELLTDRLTETSSRVEDLVRNADLLAKGGFSESAEMLSLRKQQVEIRADQARLKSGIFKLNAELKALIHVEGPQGSIMPVDQITVTPDVLDPEASVQVGLVSRPDLMFLRVLLHDLNYRTVDAIRRAFAELVPPLAAVNTTMTIVAPGLRAIMPILANNDVESMRAQLTQRLQEREREADREIRSAVEDWTSQRELVVIARQRVELHEKQLQDLKIRRDKGIAVESEYRLAELDRVKAETELIREAIKWKIADVKARQAMGILCGEDCTPACRK